MKKYVVRVDLVTQDENGFTLQVKAREDLFTSEKSEEAYGVYHKYKDLKYLSSKQSMIYKEVRKNDG